jgi:fibro-slime domain-containing protein
MNRKASIVTQIVITWCFSLPNVVQAQPAYPPTIKLPVTFFDFHSNGSCPDFNPGMVGTNYTAGLRTGMVRDTLDGSGFPLRAVDSAKVNLNAAVAKWFRPWQPGDVTVPIYNRPAGTFKNMETVNYDTAFKNIVIHDSLIFAYIPGSEGKYQFQSGAFWPLDGRGFGQEPAMLWNGTTANGHNFSFSMRMHSEFRYVAGISFTIGGDDDIWAYVNGRLAIDLGGFHPPISDSITLDFSNAARFGLDVDSMYDLDIFYTERQANQSNIILTTQISIARPKPVVFIRIIPEQDTSLYPGDTLNVKAEVVDDTAGIRHEFDSLIEWSVLPEGTTSKLKNTTGARNTYYAINAYSFHYIIAKFTDPNNSVIILHGSDSLKIGVMPPRPSDYSLTIEPDTVQCSLPDPGPWCQKSSLLDSLVFSGTDIRKTAAAVIRDKWGNFVEHAPKSDWKFLAGSDIATMSFPVKPYLAVIEALNPGAAIIEVTDTSKNFTKKDTLQLSSRMILL